MTTSSGAAGGDHQLQRGILTTRNCLALSAAAMAPVLAVVLNAPAAGSNAGAALPVAFFLAFVAALLVANTVIEFAKKMPSSGSFYTYCTRSFGSMAGFFTGWSYAAAFVVLTVGLFTANGAFMRAYLQSTFGWDLPWWLLGIALLFVALYLSIRSIKATVRLDLMLLGAEMLVFALLALIAIIKAGDRNSLSYFDPTAGPAGLSGVGLGVVFGLLSFIGFEAAATLGEETENPKRTVPLAIRGAVFGVGVFFVFVLYGLAVGFDLLSDKGLNNFVSSPAQFASLAEMYAPILKQPVEFAAVAGLFSAMLAVLNTTVRVMYAMARERVLPPALARVHPEFRSPHIAIYVLAAFCIIAGISMSAWIGSGLTDVYGFAGSLGTIGVILVYTMANLGLIKFYWRTPDFNLWRHLVAPLLGTAVLLYPLYSTIKPGQAFPYNNIGMVVGVWMLVGLAVYTYIKRRSPEKLTAMGVTMTADEIDFEEEKLPSLALKDLPTPLSGQPTTAMPPDGSTTDSPPHRPQA